MPSTSPAPLIPRRARWGRSPRRAPPPPRRRSKTSLAPVTCRPHPPRWRRYSPRPSVPTQPFGNCCDKKKGGRGIDGPRPPARLLASRSASRTLLQLRESLLHGLGLPGHGRLQLLKLARLRPGQPLSLLCLGDLALHGLKLLQRGVKLLNLAKDALLLADCALLLARLPGLSAAALLSAGLSRVDLPATALLSAGEATDHRPA